MQVLFHEDYFQAVVQNDPGLKNPLLNLFRDGVHKGWILSTGLQSVYEAFRKFLGPAAAMDRVKELQTYLSIVTVNAQDLNAALSAGDTEFEIALAVRGVKTHSLDAVLTARPKAFLHADVLAVSEDQLLKRLDSKRPQELSVPIVDIPGSRHEWLNAAESGMMEVVRSGRFILGNKVEELERKIADYCGAPYAVGVSSGTDALLISLMAAGIGAGDEVITSPFTFFATAGSIARVGATPVFADIDPATFNLSPKEVARRVTAKTRAILPVHLYGQCADMDPILDLAEKNGLTVIEDAAQAIGSEYKDKRAGSLGDYGCFSFFPTKNLGGLGDAGMVTCRSEESLEALKVLRAHGSKPKYYHQVVGGNFRLDALQAAALNAKMNFLDGWTEKRRENAGRYDRLFEKLRNSKIVGTPKERFPKHVYNQYVIRVKKNRDELKEFLNQNRVQTEIYYPVPLHLQECFASLGHKPGAFPAAEKAAEEVLALPISPEVIPEQQEYVVDRIAQFFS